MKNTEINESLNIIVKRLWGETGFFLYTPIVARVPVS